MSEVSFANLLAVAAVAFVAPLVARAIPGASVPSPVLELLAGVALGPAGLGLVEVDAAVRALATLGVSFLLFLAGMEIELPRLRGPLLRLSGVNYVVSFALALAAAGALHALDVIINPVLVGIVVSATSLGLVVPVLKDAGESQTSFGQLVIGAASVAEFAPIVLVSLFFSVQPASLPTKLLLLLALVVLVAIAVAVLALGRRSARVADSLLGLQDTSAQIRVRGATLLLLALVVAAADFRVDAILGAFLAGTLLSVVDRARDADLGHFRAKLEAVGHGLLVPVFWVTTGLNFDVGALTSSPQALLRVPLFVALLLLVRGAPALLYRSVVGAARSVAAGLLQATSLTFIAVTTTIGLELEELTRANAAALVAAGLVSVLVFPAVALGLLRRPSAPSAGEETL
ncbi:MAG TPA: cation:proton antiporter [Actinomycetota bacterium]|nr:cation:proton antiporter [Actinomycetota bacterium]